MWTCYTFTEDSHNTGNFMPYSFRIICGFFNVPRNCEHSRVVRRSLRFIVVIREDLKVLTIWPGQSRTHDLPQGKPLHNQLSHRPPVRDPGYQLYFQDLFFKFGPKPRERSWRRRYLGSIKRRGCRLRVDFNERFFGRFL